MTCTNCWTCNDRPCAMEKLHPSRHKPRPGLSPNKLYIRKTEYSIRHKIHESNYSNIHYSVRIRTPLITFSSCQFTVQQLMLPASDEVPHLTQHEERAPAKKKKKKAGPALFSGDAVQTAAAKRWLFPRYKLFVCGLPPFID